jgi:hypothetical protein
MNIAVKKINKMWLFVSVDFLFQRERGETKKKTGRRRRRRPNVYILELVI